jgi:DNA-binding NarL/FixJ family response regulator
MDGLDALGEFRRRIPDTRVVLLTVFEDPDKIFRAICAGANGYLLKTGSTATVVEAIQHAAAGGAPMTPAIAARVLSLFARIAGAPAQGRSEYGLTVREKEVLELLAEGLVAKEIAARLGISLHTVTNHQRSIYAKLHVGTNTGAVAKAIRERLI